MLCVQRALDGTGHSVTMKRFIDLLCTVHWLFHCALNTSVRNEITNQRARTSIHSVCDCGRYTIGGNLNIRLVGVWKLENTRPP